MTINVPVAFRAYIASFSIKANIPITIDNATVAGISLLPSIMESAATAPAMTAIASVITTKLPTTLLAPFKAFVMAAIVRPSIVTAPTPFAKPSQVIILMSTETAASIPIAMENANIVPATFAIFCSLPILSISTIALMSTPNATTKIPPFIISSGVSLPTSLHTPTMSKSDVEIASSIPPILASCLSDPIFVIATKDPTNMSIAPAKMAPFFISSTDSIATSLHIPTNINIAIDSFRIILPTFLVCSPAKRATEEIAITNTAKPAANIAPFFISSGVNFAASLQTPTISNRATDSLVISLPILSKCSILPNFPIRPTAPINTSIAPIVPAKARKPRFASSGFIEPISLTVIPNSSIAAPIEINPDLRPSMLRPSLPILALACDILSIANAKPTSTKESATITPVATISFLVSTSVKAITEATNIAIAIATFFRASAFKFIEKPPRTLANFFSISAKLSITSFNPFIPSANALMTSYTFLTTNSTAAMGMRASNLL